MSRLVEFLLERIAEDEAAARKVAYPHGVTGTSVHGQAAGWAATTHYAAWAPARVLAECAAKREFLTAVMAAPMWPDEKTALSVERAIQLLAQPYADHPDYRQEWRP